MRRRKFGISVLHRSISHAGQDMTESTFPQGVVHGYWHFMTSTASDYVFHIESKVIMLNDYSKELSMSNYP